MANIDELVAKQQIDELTAAFGRILSAFSAEEIARLNDKNVQLVQEIHGLVVKLSQPKPVARPVHEKIRIWCTIGGRNYVACGFLKKGEQSVDGQTMLDRTKMEGMNAADEDEWKHLWENRADFEKFPELKSYYVITGRRSPVFPQALSCLYQSAREWDECSSPVKDPWSRFSLVLRCCP